MRVFFNFVARKNFAKKESRSPRGFLPRPLLRAGESITQPPYPQKNCGGVRHSFFSKRIRANDTITSPIETFLFSKLRSDFAEAKIALSIFSKPFPPTAEAVNSQSSPQWI
jgi:hypothetical protein